MKCSGILLSVSDKLLAVPEWVATYLDEVTTYLATRSCETIAKFDAALRKLAIHCQFGETLDWFISGLRHNAI